MLREHEIELRRQRGRLGRYTIENLGKNRVLSDYRVRNPDTGGDYTVTIRGFDVGDNQCNCPDYKSNTLITCKHIEAVLAQLTQAQPAHVQRKKAQVTRPELGLHYGDPIRLQLRLPKHTSDKLTALARKFFDDKGLWSGKAPIEEIIPTIDSLTENVFVYQDAMEFISVEVERHDMLAREQVWLEQVEAGTWDWDLLKVPLYAYQLRGALFLACHGRSILGDDMGLGKTVQTLAAVEILARERGVGRVLVVTPSSVKYQWEAEIRKFTKRDVRVIEGPVEVRKKHYTEPSFYRIVNYELLMRDDLEALNAWEPDVVVLDEAQRIKSWSSKTAKAVKKLKSRYAMVLTGTPLENRLEELYSIVSFVDEHRFGPAFQFLHEHRILDAQGNVKGYRNLNQIKDRIAPVFLRRTRAEVLGQLPSRTDSSVYVELLPQQKGPYEEQRTSLAALLRKGYLIEQDRKRLLGCLTNLRTLCDTTAMFDPNTNVSSKLDELKELLPELLQDGEHKLVIFSEWETMLRETSRVLATLGYGHVVFHGSLTGPERKAMLNQFQTDQACRAFLSTDAGGVGLNLQVADTVINLELPWNPAVLEQRIARVHRMGQEKPVRVVNLIARGTIEERVQKVLEAKRGLFAGVFESTQDELAMDVVGQESFLNEVRELLDDVPVKPVVTPLVTLQVPSGLAESALKLLEAAAEGLATMPLSEDQQKRIDTAMKKLRGKGN